MCLGEVSWGVFFWGGLVVAWLFVWLVGVCVFFCSFGLSLVLLVGCLVIVVCSDSALQRLLFGSFLKLERL